MAQQTFKERVAQVAIEQAKAYKAVYVDYEYLICSEVFSECEYYIIAATASNYRHLIGVNTEMTAEELSDLTYGLNMNTSEEYIKCSEN